MLIKYHHIPSELQALPQWVCWRFEYVDGELTKVPKNPRTGQNASTKNPTTWASYSEANAAAVRDPNLGVGFVFKADGPFVGIDIDDCILPDGSFTDEGKQALWFFGDSYHEVSPGGKGLKFWIRGILPTVRSGRKNSTLGVEAYRCRRFFTVTGSVVNDQAKPILDRNEALLIWYGQKFPPDTDIDTYDFEEIECSDSAEEIIAKATAVDRRFAALFDGDWSECKSPSEADFALCSRVARLTGPDPNRIDEVFRESELYREKWERNDYRTNTIKKAIAFAASFHDPIKEFASLANHLRNLTFQQGSSAMTIPALPNSVASVCTSAPEWPELQLLASNFAAEMSPDDFPPVIKPIVRAVADYTETPVELPGLMAIGVLATACQGKYEVCLPDGYAEPLSLWVCAAMEAGNRKTAVVNAIVKPLRDWESDQQIQCKPAIAENVSRRKTIEKRIDHLRAAAAKSNVPAERQDFEQQIISLERELPPIQHYPTLMTDDCTPEKLATLMSEQDEKMAIISDEGGVFGQMAGRYSKGVPNLEVYLQSHSGSPIKVHRGSRPPIDLKAPCLTIAVSPQPSVLEQVARNADLTGRGLLERFLFAMPKSLLGYRHLQSRPIPEEVSYQWNQIVRGILNLPQRRNDFGLPVPQKLHLSDEAFLIWKDEQRATETEMLPGNFCFPAKLWAAKYPGAVLRIAAIIHIAMMVDLGLPPECHAIVDVGMRNAISLGKKLKQQSLQAFGLMRLDADQQMAHRLSEWILRRSKPTFRARDVARELNGGRSNDGVSEALKILVEFGWIRPTPTPAAKGKGRPPIQFDVNPQLFSNR